MNVAAEVAAGLYRLRTGAAIRPGQRIAITAGNRGVTDLVPALRAAAAGVRRAGGKPFVVPCMGSHGGATAEGQRAVLRDLGVTAEAVDAAVVSSMDVVAVVEDQRDRTARVEVVAPEAFFTREAELLGTARRLLPHLPFDDLDVLVVAELGKDVRGTGMDTNVIGRMSFWGGGEPPSRPRITRILVRGLTTATHGNDCGIGMADFTTTRCAAAIDRAATEVNCITSYCPEDVRLPIALASDREALAACLQTSGVREPRDVRLAWIHDNAHLERPAVSEALLDEERAGEALRPAGPLFPLPYDENGDLRSPFVT